MNEDFFTKVSLAQNKKFFASSNRFLQCTPSYHAMHARQVVFTKHDKFREPAWKNVTGLQCSFHYFK